MRLTTIRLNGTTTAARVEESRAVTLPFASVGELLASGADWQERAAKADGPSVDAASLDYAPVVPTPEKIVCVGLNYRAHVDEAQLAVADYPVLFAKYSRSLVGAQDPIVLPAVSQSVDWEAELGVVIGRHARNVSVHEARDAIAGYTVVNDISMRDWQTRTSEFLQGKTFESSTPVGPWLVTADEIDDPGQLDLSCSVNGATMQSSNTRHMIFGIEEIVSYISSFITLVPGDLIATGTPSGVGVARTPPIFLQPGDIVHCAVEGLGEQRNRCVASDDAPELLARVTAVGE